MKIFISLVLILVLASSVFWIYTNYNNQSEFHFKYENGNLQEELTSPSGDYTARVYHHYYGGAAGGVNLYVNIIFHAQGNEERTIYFSDAKTWVNVTWNGNNELSITNSDENADRSIVLNVENEIFDESGRACREKIIKDKFTCFSSKNKKS